MSPHTLLDVELWRPVNGYEDRYEVSSLGRVRSILKNGAQTRILRPAIKCRKQSTGIGYPTVALSKVGVPLRYKSVHLLVLEAFCGPKPQGKEGAHLDGNSQNCTISNLAWVTHAENIAHKFVHGTNLKGSAHPSVKLSVDQVLAIRKLAAEERLPQTKIAKIFGIRQSHVSAIHRRKFWSHI